MRSEIGSCAVLGYGLRVCQTSKVPGEEAFEKGSHIKLWVRHDSCVQVEVVQPVIPAVVHAYSALQHTRSLHLDHRLCFKCFKLDFITSAEEVYASPFTCQFSRITQKLMDEFK